MVRAHIYWQNGSNSFNKDFDIEEISDEGKCYFAISTIGNGLFYLNYTYPSPVIITLDNVQYIVDNRKTFEQVKYNIETALTLANLDKE